MNKLVSWFLFINICFAFFAVSNMRNGYDACQKEICAKLEAVFKDAVELDRKRLYEMEPVHVNQSSNPADTISIEERAMHRDLERIIKKDPNRSALDSLFRLKINERKIQARCAVQCISRFGVTNSSSDSLFYEKSIQLPPLIYRPLKDSWKNRVELHAYVQISDLFIIRQIPGLGFILFLWFLVNVFLWGVYWYWPKYKARILAKNKKVEIQTVVKVITVEKFVPVKSFTKRNVFPAGFQFDKNTGLMNYNDQTVQLTGQKLKLFCYFLNMKQSVLTNEDIGKHLYNLDESASGLPGRISMAVARLRESLAPFPFIQIEAVRGTGYQLIITQSD